MTRRGARTGARTGKSARRSRVLLAVVVALTAAPAPAANFQLSADVSLRLVSVGFDVTAPDHAYLLDDGVRVTAQVTRPQIPAAANLDALDLREDDSVLFSLDTTAVVGGVYAEDGDAISCRFGSCSIAFDASVAGLPPGLDLDAIATRNGRLLLSFDKGFHHGVLGFIAANDAVEFNGAAFTAIAFDASVEAIPANANLDALNASGDGHLQLSFERTLDLGGVVAFDHDVIEFNPSTHAYSIARALGTENAAWWRADLDAIAGASLATSYRLFRDGFE